VQHQQKLPRRDEQLGYGSSDDVLAVVSCQL
jgi:hypothetical protein